MNRGNGSKKRSATKAKSAKPSTVDSSDKSPKTNGAAAPKYGPGSRPSAEALREWTERWTKEVIQALRDKTKNQQD